MRNLIILFSGLFLAMQVQAQKLVEASLAVTKGDGLHLDFKFADSIAVHIWEKQEVLVKASANINDNQDNELYNMKAEKIGNKLHFYSDNKWLKASNNKCGNCNCSCNNSEIRYEVYMPASLDFYSESISGSLSLEGLTGRIDINTISGNITLKSPPKDVRAKTISGDVEFLVKKSDQADFSASTISGDIYTNVDIEFTDNKEGLNQVVGRKVRGKINGGGSSWTLDTISGNIYLRQI